MSGADRGVPPPPPGTQPIDFSDLDPGLPERYRRNRVIEVTVTQSYYRYGDLLDAWRFYIHSRDNTRDTAFDDLAKQLEPYIAEEDR